ncbi:MAG: DNA repair protein RadC [Spirochaetia bacterium]|nr:DNA repair protein RadC [Spirochaetia bacterium]
MYNSHGKILHISQIPVFDRPREKLRDKGVAALTDVELIAVFLGAGTAKTSVLKLAELVSNAVDESDPKTLFSRLMKIPGIGEARAFSICAAMEFVRRKKFPAVNKIHCASDVYAWLRPYCDKKQEHFIVFTINGGNEIMVRRVITVGLLNSSQIHPREVFADAIADRAASIILAHNHPSGNTDPSPEDIFITKKLQRSGEILGVNILDHLVFSHSGYTSFLEKGML